MVHDKFRNWLKHEIDKRYWTYNELARRAQLSSAAISMVMTGQRNPGIDFCKGIADALGIDARIILDKADLLPLASTSQEEQEELLFLFENLSIEDQERILIIMRSFKKAHDQREKGGNDTDVT